MADELIVSLLELLRKTEPAERADFVRQAVERLAQAIVELEVEQKIGAARYERTETRANSRNGRGASRECGAECEGCVKNQEAPWVGVKAPSPVGRHLAR
jgi:hypothetical protein